MNIRTNRIKGASTWDSGGGVELDLIELTDGRVLCVSDEAVVLYKDMEDLEAGDPSVSRPHIDL